MSISELSHVCIDFKNSFRDFDDVLTAYLTNRQRQSHYKSSLSGKWITPPSQKFKPFNVYKSPKDHPKPNPHPDLDPKYLVERAGFYGFRDLMPANPEESNLAGAQSLQRGILPVEISQINEEIYTESETVRPYVPQIYPTGDDIETLEYGRYGDGGTLSEAPGIFAYCYPFVDEEINSKCSNTEGLGNVAIYIPMMMDIQWKYHEGWYTELKHLKESTKLQLFGIAYGNPKWKLIVEILKDNPLLFDGILLEWVEPDSCISKIALPKYEELDAISATTTEGVIRYLVRDQNFYACGPLKDQPKFLTTHYESLHQLISKNELAHHLAEFESDRESKGFWFPAFIQPLFLCSGGQEGLCYRTIHTEPHRACRNTTRFMFNPYEINGGRLMHMLNETCAGLPTHDLYGVL